MEFTHENVIDLRRVARLLENRFHERPPRGAVMGKTEMRDAIVDATSCSLLNAEQLVDQLERLGYIRLVGERMRPPRWRITAEPSWLH